MSELREKIAEICKFKFCQPNDLADQILALLPDLSKWVKVERCKDVEQESKYYGHSQCTTCHGTGTISSPLELGDARVDEMIDTLILLRDDFEPGTVGRRWIDDALTTKSGAKIERKK